MDKLERKQRLMLTAPVERLVVRLSIPSIIIMLITAAYNLADTYFVSGLGTSATAAIGVVFSLMGVIQAIGFFFGHGSGNYISRKLGAKEFADAEIMASTGFFFSIIAGSLLGVFGLLFMHPLLLLLGASETMLPYARDYTCFILISALFMTSSLTLNNQLRFVGSAKWAMFGMVTGAVLNIALDPLFIYKFSLGAWGAGLATCVSQIIGFIILLWATRREGNIAIHFRHFKPSFQALREMARGGSPSLLRQTCNCLGILCFNHAAGAFGDSAVAAISITQRVTMFAYSALLGFGQGFQPVCGFNYGAKRYDRVVRAFWFGVKIVSSCLLLLALIGAVFAPSIIALFRADDPRVIAIGTAALRFQCITVPFCGMIMMFNMMLQTIGATAKASLIAVSRSGLFLIPAIILMKAVFGLGGIEAAQAVTDILSIALALPLGFGTLRSMKNSSMMSPAA